MKLAVSHEGVTVTLEAPAAAVIEPRAFDASSVPGAAIVLSRAWDLGAARFDVVCVRAPSRGWVPGLEGAILDGASAKVRAAADLASLAPGPIEPHGDAFEQSFSGQGSTVSARGRHYLGFIAPDRDALACSAVCTAANSTSCDAALASLQLDAHFMAPPAPGLLARTVSFAVAHPRPALASAALVTLAAAALLLHYRPRPRRY